MQTPKYISIFREDTKTYFRTLFYKTAQLHFKTYKKLRTNSSTKKQKKLHKIVTDWQTFTPQNTYFDQNYDIFLKIHTDKRNETQNMKHK